MAIVALMEGHIRGEVAADPVWACPTPPEHSRTDTTKKFVLVRPSAELVLSRIRREDFSTYMRRTVLRQYTSKARSAIVPALAVVPDGVSAADVVPPAQGLVNVQRARAVVWPVAHDMLFALDRATEANTDNKVEGHWAVLVADMVESKFWWIDSSVTSGPFNDAARGAALIAAA